VTDTAPADDIAVDEADVEWVRGVSYPKVAALLVVVALVAAIGGWVLGERSAKEEAGGSAIDEGFAVDMRAHHQQAIEMSLAELGVGDDPVVVGFAREILVRQDVELGLLAAELDDWGVEVSSRPDTAMAWMGSPVPWREMPGLATEAQMADLRAASGAEADALFLELMVEHHRGGVHMASYAAEHGTSEDVRALARTMASTQAVEIEELEDTARRLGFDAGDEPATTGTTAPHDH